MANLNETTLDLSAAHIQSPKRFNLAIASRRAALSGNASLIATFSSWVWYSLHVVHDTYNYKRGRCSFLWGNWPFSLSGNGNLESPRIHFRRLGFRECQASLWTGFFPHTVCLRQLCFLSVTWHKCAGQTSICWQNTAWIKRRYCGGSLHGEICDSHCTDIDNGHAVYILYYHGPGAVRLTLSVPHFCLIVAKTSLPKRSGPYWSNPPFLVFWHSGTLALNPERQSARMSKN